MYLVYVCMGFLKWNHVVKDAKKDVYRKAGIVSFVIYAMGNSIKGDTVFG